MAGNTDGAPELGIVTALLVRACRVESLLPQARILLVEDEFLIRLILSEALVEAGYDVSEAETGDEAMDMIETQEGFDMLVTDIQMPGATDGIALAAVIRARYPGIPVVYMTGRPDVMRGAGRLSTREAFIRKPYGPAEVLSTIERLLVAEGSGGR